MLHLCQGRSTPYIGDGRAPPFLGNPYNGYINPYYWVDDHPLLHGNNGSLDPIAHCLGTFLLKRSYLMSVSAFQLMPEQHNQNDCQFDEIHLTHFFKQKYKPSTQKRQPPLYPPPQTFVSWHLRHCLP